MKTKNLYIGLAAAAAIIVAFLMLGPLYVIQEGSQAVITRFGLSIRLPFTPN